MAGSDRGMVVVGLDNLSIDREGLFSITLGYILGYRKNPRRTGKKWLGNMLRVALIIQKILAEGG